MKKPEHTRKTAFFTLLKPSPQDVFVAGRCPSRHYKRHLSRVHKIIEAGGVGYGPLAPVGWKMSPNRRFSSVWR